MQTGDLCYVFGYVEPGRILSLEIAPGWYDDQPTLMARIELPSGVIETDVRNITKSWAPADTRVCHGVPRILSRLLHDFDDTETEDE